MERTSAKHGRRIDEQEKHELPGDANRSEGRSQETPTVEEQGPGYRPELLEAPPGGLPEDALDRRERLAVAVGTAEFPADKAALGEAARAAFAEADVLEAIDALPEGQAFANTGEVWRALGEETEHRG